MAGELSALLKRLEIGVRTRMPKPMRRLYRVARAAGVAQALSPGLPQELVDGARLVASRDQLIELLPKGGTIAELGTWRGHFARTILDRCQPDCLHVIDIDFSQFDRTLEADQRLRRHEGLTQAVIAGFPDEHFDWIYVDGDHSYRGAAGDAAAAAPKVKPGGLLIFNDFAHIDPLLGRYGVHRAVSEFMLEHRWPIAFFAMHPAALYDIALRKPG